MAPLGPSLLSTLLLQLLLLLLAAPLGDAFEAPRLTRCPQGDLTLEVPEDLSSGSALFTWDPAQLAVKSDHENYKRMVNRALNHASAGARAFFSDGLDDAFSLVPGAARATLVSELPAGGTNLLRGRFLLTCSPVAPANGPRAPSRQFRLHLRLTRQPMRLSAEPRRPLVAREGTPAGTVLANVSAFAFGRRVVTPAACVAAADAPGSGAALTVGSDGRVALAEPLGASSAEWTFTVTCGWSAGLRARIRVTVAPLKLWRRQRSRIHAAASADAAALTGARVSVSLGALLVRPGPRVRLAGSSDPARVRLAPGAFSLLLDLTPGGDPLAVTLEATDEAGRSEATSLLVTSGGLEPRHPGPCRGPDPAWPGWWPAPVLAGAVALCLACAWPAIHRRVVRGGSRGGLVKPEFV